MSCTNTMNKTIADTEFLYRGIIEEWFDKENNRISSAAFKDKKGVSVDRDGNERKEKECKEAILSIERKPPRKPFDIVCKLLTKQVRESGAFVKHCPSINNKYHSEIHNSEKEIPISSSKARALSKIAQII